MYHLMDLHSVCVYLYRLLTVTQERLPCLCCPCEEDAAETAIQQSAMTELEVLPPDIRSTFTPRTGTRVTWRLYCTLYVTLLDLSADFDQIDHAPS